MQRKTLIGVLFMLGAMGILPMIDVIAKHLGQVGIPILQIVWARLALGALVTLPIAARHGSLMPERPWLHTARACFLMAATFLFFSALKFLPIADALAIFFVQPLVLTSLSPWILRENVSLRRWAAVGAGFVGTLIIIRPGLGAFNPGSLLALGSGTSLALYFLLTRKISGTAPAIVTTFQTNAIGGIIASALVPLVWIAPSPTQWGLFLALAVIANLGHWLIVRAYDHAEASLLAPLAYTEMVTSTLFGLLFFNDFPDFWTFVGVAILIGCAIFVSTVKEPLPEPP